MKAFLWWMSLLLAWMLLTVIWPVTEGQAAREPALEADAFLPPPPPVALSGTTSPRGPSQFMAGDVAVLLILPESDGSLEASHSDWSPEQIAQVEQQIRAALDWWEAQLPLADLRFTLRTVIAPTAYEPTNHAMANEYLWIGDLFSRMGYTGDNYFDQAYKAIYALRDELDTDWATAIIVANSSGTTSGRFSDGRFAYAYIGGPFSVVTSDVGPNGSAALAAIVAHELSHSFGALDQYAAARVQCTRASGYLHAPTTNSQTGGCGPSVPSLLLEPLSAYAARQIDASALAQLGYHDSDNDGLIDPLDTTPVLEATITEPASGRPTLAGYASDQGFPSPLQRVASINTIAHLEYRVPGGSWQIVPIEHSGQFSTELSLYDGSYLVEVQAVNERGNRSVPHIFAVEVQGVGPQPPYGILVPAITASDVVTVSLEAPLGSMVQISEQPELDDVPWQPLTPAIVYQFATPAAGPRPLYVRFRDTAGLLSLTYEATVVLEGNTRLFLPMLAHPV
jgi:hypothetical protein